MIERCTRVLGWLGGVLLFWLMFLTVAAVVMRYLFNAPILGAQDLSELTLVAVVYLGLPYCGSTEGHVAVDLIGALVKEERLRITDALTRLVGGALFLVLAWQSVDQGLDALDYGVASNLVDIPHYPFFFLVGFCSLLYALVLFLQAYARLSTPRAASSS